MGGDNDVDAADDDADEEKRAADNASDVDWPPRCS
jgi:hypothetical protein